MTEAKQGDTVQTHYTGKLDDGTVFDSSEGKEPLEFIVGAGQVIPGFEQGVVGMSLGESKTITIPVDEAYGPREEGMVLVFERKEFPPDLDPKVGEKLEMHQPDGAVALVTVLETSPESVTIDVNHPLAGQALTFDIKLVGILGEPSKSRPSTSGP